MTGLSKLDLKILSEALAAGQNLERHIGSDLSQTSETEESLGVLSLKFTAALDACAEAESTLVKKLAELAPKVLPKTFEPKTDREKYLKHLMALLVPLERLAGRSRRDEEFLYFATDRTTGQVRRSESREIIAVLENLRSSFNVGAIYRTLETFGGTKAWLCGYTPDPQKTAMGTDEIIEVRRFDRSPDAIANAKKLGYTTVALELSDRAIPLSRFSWPERTALIVGNERFGVDSETLAACDHVVKIETLGHKNSLNVGVAFGIALAAAQANPVGSRTLRPIGYLRGGFLNPQVAPRQGSYDSATAEICFERKFDGAPSNFEQALKDLEGFERAWLLFDFHENESWKPQVRPPRGDGIKRGVFSTRSPHRPNGLGLTSVKILNVDATGLKLEISEHDLLDGTPIYDIKPYVPQADAFPSAKAGWVDTIESSRFEIEETERARKKLDWLESQGERRLRLFIHEQLAFQPFDSDRKRVSKSGAQYTIAFRTWRIDFDSEAHSESGIAPESRRNKIVVVDVRSGYGESELETQPDPYADKELHRRFKAVF